MENSSTHRSASPSQQDDDGLPTFIPVPMRPRHDGWTPARQRLFIEWLTISGCVAHAAKAAGKSQKSVYALRHHAGAESFCAAWDRALELRQQRLADSAYERAIEGTLTPVFYRGKIVGEKRRYNERLLIAALMRRAGFGGRGVRGNDDGGEDGGSGSSAMFTSPAAFGDVFREHS